MKKSLMLLSLVSALLVQANALAPYRARAAKIVYGSPEDYQLGKELCAVFAKLGAKRKPVFKAPLFISQFVPHRVGQLSFTETLWNDRQLFCDRRLWVTKRTDFQLPSVIKCFEEMKNAGYDGATAWTYPGYRRAWVYYLQAAKTVGDFKMFPGGSPGVRDYSRMEKALGDDLYKHPAVLRVDGIPLFRGYYSDRGAGLAGVDKYLENIRKSTGGRDVKYMTELFMIHSHKRLSREERKNFQAQISLYWQKRKYSGKAALCDYDYITDFLRQKSNGGICYGPYMNDQALKFPTEFYESYILPLFTAALAQDEFNGKKLFTVNFKCGYTNPCGSQTLNRDGTKTLRRNLETFLKYKPDVLIGSEWDELNEDTSLGPTVVRPMSSSRITRYYSAISKGKKVTPMPGDDLNVPNMIISQRRELYYGAEFELEILNVPDGSKKETFFVEAELFDHNGKSVYKSKKLAFDSSKMMDHTISLNSANLTDCRLIFPKITIHNSKGKQVYSDGLPFTAMRPAVCDDHSWYCTPLRNLLKPESAKVSFKKESGNLVGVEADLNFKEKINSVEVLQNVYSVSCFDPNDEFGTANGSKQLFLLTLTDLCGKKVELDVNVNVDSAVTFTIPADPREVAMGKFFPVKAGVGKGFTKLFFVVDKKDVASAVVTVKGKDIDFRFPLAELKAGDVISKTDRKGVIAALQNTPRALRRALPMEHGKVNWKTSIPVTLPDSAMVLRVVSQNGKVWYSKGFPNGVDSSKSEKMLNLRALNELRKWQSFKLPASRVPVIDYEFDPANGATLRTAAGKEFYAQLGGHAHIASGQNGNRLDNKPGLSSIIKAGLKKAISRPAPEWKRENKRPYLHFDGKSGSFIMLSRTAVPQYAGFHMTMEIRPLSFTARQILLCNYNYYQTGYELHIANGKLGASPVQRRPHDNLSYFWTRENYESKLALELGKWNTVELIYDGKNMTLGVNGKYESFAHDGASRWLSVSAFGGWNNEMFHGDLRRLTINPALPEKR